MAYKIKINYQTGDSFNKWDEEKVLDISWKNSSDARLNLKRLKHHYDWLCDKNNRWKDDAEKTKMPNWLIGKEYPECTVVLLDDNGDKVEIHTCWTGYFERVHEMSIISDPRDGWSYSW